MSQRRRIEYKGREIQTNIFNSVALWSSERRGSISITAYFLCRVVLDFDFNLFYYCFFLDCLFFAVFHHVCVSLCMQRTRLHSLFAKQWARPLTTINWNFFAHFLLQSIRALGRWLSKRTQCTLVVIASFTETINTMRSPTFHSQLTSFFERNCAPLVSICFMNKNRKEWKMRKIEEFHRFRYVFRSATREKILSEFKYLNVNWQRFIAFFSLLFLVTTERYLRRKCIDTFSSSRTKRMNDIRRTAKNPNGQKKQDEIHKMKWQDWNWK